MVEHGIEAVDWRDGNFGCTTSPRAGSPLGTAGRAIGAGVFEIALPFRGDAYRVVYGVQVAEEIRVVHAFQKKLAQGMQTPQREIELIQDRLKRLKEMLR